MAKVSELLDAYSKNYKTKVAWVGVQHEDVDRLSTGSLGLDIALGGGMPVGKVSILYGPESSMKTSISLKCIADAQRKWPNKTAVFIDVEGHFDANWAKTLGVDTEALGYVSPDTAEQVVDMVEGLLRAEDISVVVIDSLAALITAYELDESAEKAIVGKTGIIINKLYRKVTAAFKAAKKDGQTPTLICINQIRMNIGQMFGDPEIMPGGPSFKFISSLTIKLYGKDEIDKSISEALPAFKKISATVKKWKIPIYQRSPKCAYALLPNPQKGLGIGDADDIPIMFHYFKYLELLTKVGTSGWSLTDPSTGEVTEYKTQVEIKDRLGTDQEFRRHWHGALVTALLAEGGI